MAKKTRKNNIKMVSTAGTGVFIIRFRNPKKKTEKMSFMRYDQVVRKHVEFKEAKLK